MQIFRPEIQFAKKKNEQFMLKLFSLRPRGNNNKFRVSVEIEIDTTYFWTPKRFFPRVEKRENPKTTFFRSDRSIDRKFNDHP